jgi:penicillin amidase
MTAVPAESEPPGPVPDAGGDLSAEQDDPRTPFREWPAAGRWTIYLIAGLVLALLAATVGTAAVVRRSFPRTDGTLSLAGIDAAADVRRDRLGIPHVLADGAHDLFFAQGYAQAQDRFFAMDVARHRAAGRLSELLGRSALSSDLVARTLGWRYLAEAEYPDLARSTKSYLHAFSAGVNAYLAGHTPSRLSLEYSLLEVAGLDYKPERWSPLDSLAILKADGSAWRDDVDDEVTRARLAIDRTPAQVEELYPAGAPVEGDADAFVVPGTRTASGHPLLADAIAGTPGLPSPWVQVSLRCRRVDADCPFDVTGATFDGVPGVLAGRNANLAWGLARSRADVADLFLEKVDGRRYLRGRRWLPLGSRDELIRIQGAASKTFTVRSTDDGPLLSDVSGEVSSVGANARVPAGSPARGNGYAVALAATALTPARTADALFALDRATDAHAVRSAASGLALPGHDLLYAAADGAIGAVTLGPLPVRATGRRGTDATAGWRLRGHWTGVRNAPLPTLTVPDGGVLGGNERVRALVEHGPASGWTAAGLSRVQTDTRNPLAPVLVPALLRLRLPAGYYSTGQRLIAHWDYDQPAGSAAAAYFNAVWSNLLRLTFDDQLRRSLRPDGGPRWMTLVAKLLRQPDNSWWDDTDTPEVVEDRDTILAEAMRDARDELTSTVARDPSQWQWGRLLRVRLGDQALRPRGMGLLSGLVDRGRHGVGGGNGTVAGTEADLASGYDVTTAPVLRFVADLGEPADSRWVVLGGASGHAFTSHYRDQAERWQDGESYRWPFTTSATEDVLRLRRSD